MSRDRRQETLRRLHESRIYGDGTHLSAVVAMTRRYGTAARLLGMALDPSNGLDSRTVSRAFVRRFAAFSRLASTMTACTCSKNRGV